MGLVFPSAKPIETAISGPKPSESDRCPPRKYIIITPLIYMKDVTFTATTSL
ncbi:hypothetical protein MtrunA17_Chr2g0283401 [Medicago truncatula]|uniref:Uncharacterized protein n=1 Tax=Medicago truncatula TaxID=3880 RepID=A0A396J664_MEDTR|nr:hypothetical protein MtrunA17_Chr2g0283401 [Medicago truncatula]